MFPDAEDPTYVINYYENEEFNTDQENLVNDDDEEEKEDVQQYYDPEYIRSELKDLSQARVEQTKYWYQIVCAIFNCIEDKNIAYKIAEEWSKKTTKDNFTNEGLDSAYDKAESTTFDIKTIKRFLRKDQKIFYLLLKGTDQAIAEVVSILYGKKIKLLNNKQGYYYDEKKKIWKYGKTSILFNFFHKGIVQEIEKSVRKLLEKQENENQKKVRECYTGYFKKFSITEK